jgi:membrane protein
MVRKPQSRPRTLPVPDFLGEAPPGQSSDDEALVAGVGTGGRAFVVVCARSVQQFLTNNSMQMAAAVAFYSFFSLFPLALLIILAFDFFVPVSTPLQEENFATAFGTFIPVSQGDIATTLDQAASNKEATGPLALIVLVWASTAVFATLRKGINTAWNVRTPRPWLKERVIDLTATALAGLLFLLLLIATTVIRSFAEGSSTEAGLFSGPVWFTVTSLAITFFVLTLVYRFLPNRKVEVKNVLFGALVAAIVFEIAKAAFFAYTQTRADVNQVYGSLTTVAVLLGWLYTSAAIVLIGSLTAAIYTRLTEGKIVSHGDIWSFGILPGLRKLRRLRLRRARRHART